MTKFETDPVFHEIVNEVVLDLITRVSEGLVMPTWEQLTGMLKERACLSPQGSIKTSFM